MHRARFVLVVLVALTGVLTACGDDDDDDTSAESSDAEVTTTAPDADGGAEEAATDGSETTVGAAQDAAGDTTEVCAIAEELFAQDDIPTSDQVARYADVAPDELAEPVEIARTAIDESAGDLVALFAELAADDVEQAIFDINAWEEENCGIPHSENGGAPPTSEDDIADGAQEIAVVATDYAFDLPAEVPAGETSFVLTNDGSEAHFAFVAKLADGVTAQETLESEDGIVEVYSSPLAAPGGDDAEVVTAPLTPGNWAVYCWIPDATGTPHAISGMIAEFTVS